MATYQDRLGEVITLSSPISGQIFTAKWSGDPVRYTNKVSVHQFPNVNGSKVQAQGVEADKYFLSINFDGPDNDIDATEFAKILKEESTFKWQIDHPVKGPLFLTWIEAEEIVDPTGSGNVTDINISWIEGLPDSAEESAAQAQAQAEFQAAQANIAAAEQFEATAGQTTVDENQSILDTASAAITEINTVVARFENFNILPPQLQAIADALENTLDADGPVDLSLLAGQAQTYVQGFGLFIDKATDATTFFSELATGLVSSLPGLPSAAGKSGASTTELFASAAIVGAGQGALIGGLASRSEAISAAKKVNDTLEAVTTALDTIQTLFADNPIDVLYWSLSSAYADMLKMTADATKFLELALFALPAERRIILRENKATPQIVKDEYGTVSTESDQLGNLDFFISSNMLTGDDIYWLPAGRQVVIYQ